MPRIEAARVRFVLATQVFKLFTAVANSFLLILKQRMVNLIRYHCHIANGFIYVRVTLEDKLVRHAEGKLCAVSEKEFFDEMTQFIA